MPCIEVDLDMFTDEEIADEARFRGLYVEKRDALSQSARVDDAIWLLGRGDYEGAFLLLAQEHPALWDVHHRLTRRAA